MSYADVLESYLIPAEENFFTRMIEKSQQKKLNKAKITVLTDELKKQKAMTVAKKIVDKYKEKGIAATDAKLVNSWKSVGAADWGFANWEVKNISGVTCGIGSDEEGKFVYMLIGISAPAGSFAGEGSVVEDVITPKTAAQILAS